MFDIAPSELMIVALAAIVLIGPKDLPRVMRFAGHWAGKSRAMMRNVHGAVDEIMREAELHESRQERLTGTAKVDARLPNDTLLTAGTDGCPEGLPVPIKWPALPLSQG